MNDFKNILTIDPENWTDSDITDAADCLLFYGLAETSYLRAENGKLNFSEATFRAACFRELKRRDSLD